MPVDRALLRMMPPANVFAFEKVSVFTVVRLPARPPTAMAPGPETTPLRTWPPEMLNRFVPCTVMPPSQSMLPALLLL